MTSKKQYRTFEGEYTYSQKAYLQSWDRAVKTVEDCLEVRVFGYDPGMLIENPSCRHGNTCDLPTWLIYKIIEKAEEAKKLRAIIPPTVREGWVPESKLYEAQDRIAELELALQPFAEHGENANSWANAKHVLKPRNGGAR